jgi:hypothetical protein
LADEVGRKAKAALSQSKASQSFLAREGTNRRETS